MYKTIGEEQNWTIQKIGSSVGQRIQQSEGLEVRLGNPFSNQRDWLFGCPTGSPILHIQQYIQFGN